MKPSHLTLRDNINFRLASFKKGVWKNYDPLDGLADNTVSCIYRDSDGYLWFATEGGITRYRPGITPPRVHTGFELL